MSHLLFILVCSIWGTSFILMKKSMPVFSPLDIGAWRVIGGAAALGLILVLQRRRWPLRVSHLAPLALLAALGYALPFVVQPYVIARRGGAFMGMMMALVPLLTILVSVPMLRVYPTRRQIVGVLGGLGFLLLLYGDAWQTGGSATDVLLAASVPTIYALASNFVKRRFHDVPAMALTCGALLMSAAIMLPMSLATSDIVFDDRFPRALLALVLLGVVCTGLAGFMFYWLIQTHGPLYAGMVSYVIPIVALLWGWIDGESLTRGQLVALTGILAMVALVQWPARTATAPPVTAALIAGDRDEAGRL